MPMPTPTDEMRIADRIRHMKTTAIVTAVTAASLALVLPCPIHTY